MFKPLQYSLVAAAVLPLLSACQLTDTTTTSVSEYPSTPAPLMDYSKRDVRDDIFYFVMPDRFNNGNPANDMGNPEKPISYGGFDPSHKRGFHGGDMQGIEQKLDYLQKMGITAIWMTPILRNKAVQEDGIAHHGYWIVDFTEIDPHFGTNDDLKNLIKAAHERDMKIFFDIITNHTADVIKYEECHHADGSLRYPDKGCEYKSTDELAKGNKYTPFIPKGNENQVFPEWLNNPALYNNQGDSFWQGESSINGDFTGLDDLNSMHPQVLSGMVEIYKNLITEFKPDGFRIDTVKHVPIEFWQTFSPEIMAHAKKEGIDNFHVFGEVYDFDVPRLSSFTTEGTLPAVLDFAQQGAMRAMILDEGNGQNLESLFAADDYYSDHDSQADLLLTFLGNHDMGRWGHFIETAYPNADDQTKLEYSQLGHALMYFARGIPVIYYGDEQGFTGDGNDIDARENMFASKVKAYNDNNLIGTKATTAEDNFDQQHPLYQTFATLAQLRQQHPALRRGTQLPRYSSPDKRVFAFSRVDWQQPEEYLVLTNAESTPQTIELPASGEYITLYSQQQNKVLVADGQLTATLAPRSIVLLKSKQQLSPVEDLSFTVAQVEQSADPKRHAIVFDIPAANKTSLPMVKLETAVKQADGSYKVLATDMNQPYRALIPNQYATQGSELKVTISTLNGQSQSQVIKL